MCTGHEIMAVIKRGMTGSRSIALHVEGRVKETKQGQSIQEGVMQVAVREVRTWTCALYYRIALSKGDSVIGRALTVLLW